jgi:hypothetical protein
MEEGQRWYKAAIWRKNDARILKEKEFVMLPPREEPSRLKGHTQPKGLNCAVHLGGV